MVDVVDKLRGLNLSQVLHKALELVGLNKVEPDPLPEPGHFSEHEHVVAENHYFTFTKDGELVELDDEQLEALERKIRQDYIASITCQGDDVSI